MPGEKLFSSIRSLCTYFSRYARDEGGLENWEQRLAGRFRPSELFRGSVKGPHLAGFHIPRLLDVDEDTDSRRLSLPWVPEACPAGVNFTREVNPVLD